MVCIGGQSFIDIESLMSRNKAVDIGVLFFIYINIPIGWGLVSGRDFVAGFFVGR